MRVGGWVALLGLLLLSTAATAQLVTNQNADLVLGQANFTANGSGSGNATDMNGPAFVEVDLTTGKVFVSDFNNHRVLRYPNLAALLNDAPAEAVIGQASFAGSSANRGGSVANNSLNGPLGLALDAAGNLWVADALNNRVLRFPNAITVASGAATADKVLGQANFTTNGGAATDDNSFDGPVDVLLNSTGDLFVADQQNRRVLRFNSVAGKADGASADVVIGQVDFTTNDGNQSASVLGNVSGLALDGSGNLYVADSENHRVLRFPADSTVTSGRAATAVLGQTNSTNSGAGSAANRFDTPREVAIDPVSGQLAIVDQANDRVVFYNTPGSAATGANADVVIGQANFTANAPGNTQNELRTPRGAVYDAGGRLLVADQGNHRVLRFSPDPTVSSASPADGCIGATITLTGTHLVQANSTLSFPTAGNTPFTVIDYQTIEVVVPAGATTGNITFTSPSGNGTQAFTVNTLNPTFTAPAASACVGAATGFTVVPGGGSTHTYAWNVAGVTATISGGTTATPTITFTGAGAATVQVTVTRTDVTPNCVAIISTPVTVNALPTAGLTAAGGVSALCSGTSLLFTATGGGTYAWASLNPSDPGVTATIPVPGTATKNIAFANTTATPQTIDIRVTVTNANGCTDTETLTITVNPLPTGSLTPVAPSVCTGSSQLFTASGGTNYIWSAINPSDPDVSASIPGAGTNTKNITFTNTDGVSRTIDIQVIIEGPGGCTDTEVQTVTVRPTPTVTLLPATPSACTGASVGFTATGGVSYSWTSLNPSSPDVSATVPGVATALNTISFTNTSSTSQTIDIQVTATDAFGCTNTATQTVTVFAQPNVAVVPSSLFICGGNAFTFNASGASSFTWSTQNASALGVTAVIPGGPGATKNITFFNTTGVTQSIEIVTTGTNGPGCTDVQITPVSVGPDFTVTLNPASGTICSGSTISFTSSLGGVLPVLSYSWSVLNPSDPGVSAGFFTPGSANSLAIFSNTTNTTQTIDVLVQATSTLGCVATDVATVTVYPRAIASYTTIPTSVCGNPGDVYPVSINPTSIAGATYSLTVVGAVGASATITPSAGPNYSVSFTNASSATGTVTLRATINTPDGCSTSADRTVTVLPEPDATFSFAPTLVCGPSSNSYQLAASAIPGVNYVFDTLNSTGTATVTGIFSFAPNLRVFSFAGRGTIDVRGVVITPNGCRDTTVVTVEVRPSPQPFVELPVDVQCTNAPFQPIAYLNFPDSLTAPLAYTWSVSGPATIDNPSLASPTITPTVALPENDTIRVSVTVQRTDVPGSCQATSATQSVIVARIAPASLVAQRFGLPDQPVAEGDTIEVDKGETVTITNLGALSQNSTRQLSTLLPTTDVSTFNNGAVNSHQISVQESADGFYQLLYVESFGGVCSQTRSFWIRISACSNLGLTLTASANDDNICQGQSTFLQLEGTTPTTRAAWQRRTVVGGVPGPWVQDNSTFVNSLVFPVSDTIPVGQYEYRAEVVAVGVSVLVCPPVYSPTVAVTVSPTPTVIPLPASTQVIRTGTVTAITVDVANFVLPSPVVEWERSPFPTFPTGTVVTETGAVSVSPTGPNAFRVDIPVGPYSVADDRDTVLYFRARLTNGCDVIVSNPITVTWRGFPTTSIRANPLATCSDEDFQLSAQDGPSVTFARWRTVQGAFSLNTADPTAAYTPQPADFNQNVIVERRVSNLPGDTTAVQDTFFVYNASFTITPGTLTLCPGTSAVLTATNTIAGLQPSSVFRWSISPDPGVPPADLFSSAIGATVTFNPAGTVPQDNYTITVIMETTTRGITCSTVQTIPVSIDIGDDVSPVANRTLICRADTTGLQVTGLTAPPVSVQWSIDASTAANGTLVGPTDGQTAVVQVNQNAVLVRMQVVNSDGCTLTKTLTVSSYPEVRPTIIPQDACQGDTTIFLALFSEAPARGYWFRGTAADAQTAFLAAGGFPATNPNTTLPWVVNTWADGTVVLVPGVGTVADLAVGPDQGAYPATYVHVTPTGCVTFTEGTLTIRERLLSSFQFAAQTFAPAGGTPPPPNYGTEPIELAFYSRTAVFANSAIDPVDQANGVPLFTAWNFGDPASGDFNSSTDDTTSHRYSSSGTFPVTLYVENSIGCADILIVPNAVTILEPAYNFPTAFTPNADGVNDVFRPLPNSIDNADEIAAGLLPADSLDPVVRSLRIFDRVGNLVYQSGTDQLPDGQTVAGWDGTNGFGEAYDIGVYTYQVVIDVVRDGQVQSLTYQGIVHLLR